jgi:poly-gamma-glutamate synthesis protein (capsule biosynthesis protein)
VVVVSMHNHTGGATVDEPAQMSIDFAHACIDAGADAVFGHGPHRDRGIEIYRGKPIFYSLATLFLHNDLIKWEPDEMFLKYDLPPTSTAGEAYSFRSGGDFHVNPLEFMTTLAQARFEAKELVEVTLVPLDLGFGTGNKRMRGRPVVPEGDAAASILERLQHLSEPFGTKISIEGERGLISLR